MSQCILTMSLCYVWIWNKNRVSIRKYIYRGKEMQPREVIQRCGSDVFSGEERLCY